MSHAPDEMQPGAKFDTSFGSSLPNPAAQEAGASPHALVFLCQDAPQAESNALSVICYLLAKTTERREAVEARAEVFGV